MFIASHYLIMYYVVQLLWLWISWINQSFFMMVHIYSTHDNTHACTYTSDDINYMYCFWTPFKFSNYFIICSLCIKYIHCLHETTYNIVYYRLHNIYNNVVLLSQLYFDVLSFEAYNYNSNTWNLQQWALCSNVITSQRICFHHLKSFIESIKYTILILN